MKWIKLFTNFYSHRKTVRLQSKLGFDALWIPPRLWAYCAENQPDGNLSDYNAAEIATLIGYRGDATAMLEALLEARFLDSDPLRIHDWSEHNAFHQIYADRAKNAAAARWGKKEDPRSDPDKTRGEEISKHDPSNAPSIAKHPVSEKAPQVLEDWQIEKDLNRLDAMITKVAESCKPDPGRLASMRSRRTALRAEQARRAPVAVQKVEREDQEWTKSL